MRLIVTSEYEYAAVYDGKDGKNERRKNTALLFEKKEIILAWQSSERQHQQYAEYLHQYEQ